MTGFTLRAEQSSDIAAIEAVTKSAFLEAPHSSGTEAQIINRLRKDGDLTLSIVAVSEQEIVGHIAFSPVTINELNDDWFGLGPVSVLPNRQGEGIGAALVNRGLTELKANGAKGCVLIGDPAFYSRFGFVGDCGLTYGDVPVGYVQGLALSSDFRQGVIRYADGFEQTEV